MTLQAQFYDFLKNNEDRQAVRQFRYLFQIYQQKPQLSAEEEAVLAVGIINMVALSELGRNEKNYIPDVNAMLNSLMQESSITSILQNLVQAINQEYWMTANDFLTQLQEKVNSPYMSGVAGKCSQFLRAKHQTMAKKQQRRADVIQYDAEKIIRGAGDIMEKQQKLI